MEYSVMRLHEDKEAFADLVLATAESIGLPQIYVEKDYWVTKALQHLSDSVYVNEVVFKGGTSLSKAYRLIDRFSEDIDLAIFAGDKGDSACKRLLKNVESTVSEGLHYLNGDARESKGSKYRKTVYRYPHSIERADFGHASPELLIEINAFTHPEPYEKRELETLIAQMLAEQERKDLVAQFGLGRFSVNVLSVKRTLIEKILGIIKDSYHDDPIARLSVRIRHLYDICLILREDEHKTFVQSKEFRPLCERCIEEEKTGMFGHSACLQKPLAEAPIFSKFEEWQTPLEANYRNNFSDLVYGDLPSINEIAEALVFLQKHLE